MQSCSLQITSGLAFYRTSSGSSSFAQGFSDASVLTLPEPHPMVSLYLLPLSPSLHPSPVTGTHMFLQHTTWLRSTRGTPWCCDGRHGGRWSGCFSCARWKRMCRETQQFWRSSTTISLMQAVCVCVCGCVWGGWVGVGGVRCGSKHIDTYNFSCCLAKKYLNSRLL